MTTYFNFDDINANSNNKSFTKELRDYTNEELDKELKSEIKEENYERCSMIRDEIKRRKEGSSKELNKLEIKLKEAIDNQDFEACITIRDKIKSLK